MSRLEVAIPVEGAGAWHVNGARYVWALETLKPQAYVPGRVNRQIGIADCERLLRRYSMAKRIHGKTLKHHEQRKQVDYLSGPPEALRIDLHFILQQLHNAGLTWDSYIEKFGLEPLPRMGTLPVGFVYQLLQNLQIDRPNDVFAKPNLSEMERVDDDGLLRSLMPRVEHVRYVMPRDLDEVRAGELRKAVGELADSLRTQKILGAGALRMEDELPHLVWAVDAEELRDGRRNAWSRDIRSHRALSVLHQRDCAGPAGHRNVAMGVWQCLVSALCRERAMSPDIEQMRQLLEARDLGAFLASYQEYRRHHAIEPGVTGLTQRLFPPILRAAFEAEQLSASDIVLLWRLVRDGRLLLVENDLLVSINLRINDAIKAIEPDMKVPVLPLATFDERKAAPITRGRPPSMSPSMDCARGSATEVKRIAVASSFSFSTWSAVDAFDFRKNLCASRQEYEFLSAVRQYFPSLRAYPNQPLRNFIDIEKLNATVPLRARNYAWSAQADVLLCTADEDPVIGIELDSVHHDADEVAERDELKNLLFKFAGIPLVRIRSADTQAVRAEDFYDLLMAESKTLDALRPRRLRPRRTHDFLVPAEAAAR
jgi:hypothetical protein